MLNIVSAGSSLLRTPGSMSIHPQALSSFHLPYKFTRAFPSLRHIVSGVFARI